MNNRQVASLAVALLLFGGFCLSRLSHPNDSPGQPVYHAEYRQTGERHHERRGEYSAGGDHQAFRVEDTQDQRPPALDPNGGHPEHQNLQHLVRADGAYVVEYDNQLKGPAEVNYTLDWSTRSDEKLKRPSVPFATDEETEAKVTTQDFSRCGYDRGHQCPSFAMGAFHGRDAMIGTFICSNILPQTHLNNAGVWNSIERMEADDFAKRFGVVQITDGPVYNLNPTHIRNGIAIPAAFYKIIRRPDNQVICFLVPQIPDSPKPENYLTSLSEIRRLTGLNLLPDITDPEASRVRTKIW